MNYNLDFVRPSQRDLLKKEFERDCFSDQLLACRCYENAYIVFDPLYYKYAIFTEEGKKIEGNDAELDKSNVVNCEETAICMGFFHSVWGHNFTDNIKRFWFLYTDEGKQLVADGARIVYVCEANRSISDNGKRLFAMADVDFSMFEMVKQSTRFKKLYVPDPSLIHATITHEPIGERSYTKEFLQTIQRIKDKIEPLRPGLEKVYFSRVGLSSTFYREVGEWEIESVFRQKGYKIVHPEKLSLDEQLSILASCREFASTEGSIAHNVIFCQPGTQVVIVRKADYINTYQMVINAIANLNVTFVDAHRTKPPYFIDNKIWSGPFYMYQSKYLYQWAQLHRFARPYWLRFSYWWYILRRIRVVLRIVANRKSVHRFEVNYWTKKINECK